MRWTACVFSLAFLCGLLSLLPAGPLPESAGAGQGHWSAMMPPLVAVVMAICFRSLVAALSCAFLTGALLNFGLNPVVFVPGALQEFLWANVSGQFSLYIFGFLFALVGMVHVLYKSGGIQGLVGVFSRIAPCALCASGNFRSGADDLFRRLFEYDRRGADDAEPDRSISDLT